MPSSKRESKRLGRPWLLGWATLVAPVDIAPLVYFRIVFGAVLYWEVLRFFANGWITRYFVEPQVFFHYYGFDWIHPWPGIGMYIHFAVLGVLALCIMVGLFYRAATLLFFLGFTYVFLLDQTNYLNHFYLISLLSFLLIFLPAHKSFSFDARRKPILRSDTVPAWTIWLLRFQLAVPYVYGGLAKLNSDWLQGEPMRMWLAGRTDLPLVGPWLTEEWMVYAFSYGGLLFDLLIVPLLMFRWTRWFAVAWLIAFHLLNAVLFQIGIFPWLMLLATPVFFPPHWTRKLLDLLGKKKSSAVSDKSLPIRAGHRTCSWPVVCAVGIYVVVQLLFPFRHFLYPGNPNWTEEGHRFAWHMKLRDKRATASFQITDRASETVWQIDPRDFLSARQTRKMTCCPDMILQFSHFLADLWGKNGYPDVEVRAQVSASLNGRKPQPLIDPSVDLAKQPRNLRHCDWILPLREPLSTKNSTPRGARDPASDD